MKRTRREAIAAGEKYYYTGKECIHGHISKRAVVSGNCIKCTNTIHKHLRIKYDNSPEARMYNTAYHNKINDITRKKAVNTKDNWTTKDLETATAKDSDGKYILTAAVTANLLGRSYRSIEHVRNKNNRKTLNGCK